MKATLRSILVIVALVLLALSCAPAKAPKAEVPSEYRSLRMVGVSVGGQATIAYMALTVILNKYYPQIEWSSSSGSAGTNPIYLVKGSAKLAAVPPAAYVAAFGFDKIAESRLRSIMLSFRPSDFVWLIPDDKPWKEITEVPKGLTLSPGPAGGTGELLAGAWLNLCGLSKKDFNWVPLGKTEMADAWRAGKLDLVFSPVTSAEPFLLDMWTSPRKFKPLGLSPEQAARAKAEQTFERLGFKGATKSSLTELAPDLFKYDVTIVQGLNFLGVRDDFPEDIAYKMGKTIDEHNAELVSIYAGMKGYTTPRRHIEYASPPADIHPGVAKYYREKGYLK